MKTKLSILLLTVVSLLANKLQAETKTLIVNHKKINDSLVLKDDEVAKCVYWNVLLTASSYTTSFIVIEKDGIRIQINTGSELNTGSDAKYLFPVITGPAKIELQNGSRGTGAIASFEITPNETATSKAAGPALVLPEGGDGKQKLVLESSTDLINWTEDSLGSKDSSAKKRFYRLRAVKE